MSYCVYTDVVNEFKSLDITSGIITSAKITEMIAQADAYIDGRAGLIFQIPIVGTTSLLILKQISIGLVADRLANILRLKSASPDGVQLIQKDLAKQARADLEMIVNQTLNLPDAVLLSQAGAVRSFSSEHPTLVRRTFRQGINQW